MHKPIFLLGIILVLSSFLLIGYNFAIDSPDPGEPGFIESKKSESNTHIVGMGILLLGGLLIGISKAMKKAAASGRSLIDEMIDMQGNPTPKNKTKNITIEGDGNTVDSNKKNISINQPPITTYKPGATGEKEMPFNTSLKDLIENNKQSECLGQMRGYFKNNGNEKALNDVIHLRSRLRENDDRYDSGLINDELRNREKAKIFHAILNLINHEISA